MSRIYVTRAGRTSPAGFSGSRIPWSPLPASTLTLQEQMERSERFGHHFGRYSLTGGPESAPAISDKSALAASTGGQVIQAVQVPSKKHKPTVKAKRHKPTVYNKTDYKKSSKFRFARFFRRSRKGFTTQSKAGINLFTVKYKKDGKSYYLTTRSVPHTNKDAFKIAPGHSEQRFERIKSKFLAKHKLKDEHFQYGATEREPCGEGAGMAKCRKTLSEMKFSNAKIYFAHEYADREDMRANPSEESKALNEKASEERAQYQEAMEEDLKFIRSRHDSESPSEDDADVIDEYESDYGEDATEKRKKADKNLEGAFRKGVVEGK